MLEVAGVGFISQGILNRNEKKRGDSWTCTYPETALKATHFKIRRGATLTGQKR